MGDGPVGTVVLIVAIVACAAAGAWLLVLAHRRSAAAAPPAVATEDLRGLLARAARTTELGTGGLALLLFSRASCPRCRDTREVLDAVAAERGGLPHREIDVASSPELVSALGVRTTPTVVVVDATGSERLRVAGVPRREDLLAALAPHLP